MEDGSGCISNSIISNYINQAIPTQLIPWLNTTASQCCGQPIISEEWDIVSEQLDITSEEIINKIMPAIANIARKVSQLEIAWQPESRFSHIDLCDLCRLYLLLRVKQRFANGFGAMVKRILRYCDDEEKTSLVKGLMVLDPQGLLCDVVIDLCRTNSTDLLAAIALNNDYPTRYFPELNYNQLVLKSLFCQLDIRQIVGLEKRRNDELTRMVCDYKEERLAANRSLPDSLDYALQ